jgi:hypothetical protein
MTSPYVAAQTSPRLLVPAGVLLLAMRLGGAPVGPTPAPPAEANQKKEPSARLGTLAESGLGKRDFKAQKRERQREDMLRRMERQAQGAPPRRTPASTAPKPVVSNRGQLAEDFDWSVNWEQKDNRGAHPGMDYGYASTNHLAAASLAPGEAGGSVTNNGISWFADNVAAGVALLELDTPLTASGWCIFTATAGNVSVGWFNSETYAAPDVVPDNFIGWRQDGAGLRAALGHTGTSFIEGPAVKIEQGKAFQWTLAYTPAGGAHACGQITLTVGGASSTLPLTQEQRDALAANGFDRFGIVTASTGDQTSTLWLDNVIYTRIAGLPVPHAEATAHTRTAFLDTDPTGSTFFAVNNLSPHEPVTVIQDYGYRPSGGRSGGCVGGRSTPAIGTSYYGYDYGQKMLHFTDKLKSEGWFQVPSYEGRCIHFGWTSKKGMSWHEPSTLALRVSTINIKGKGPAINIAAEGTMKNYEGHGGAGWGTVVTIPAGPEWHHYVMEFDPDGALGLGTYTVNIDGTSKVFYFGEEKLKEGADIELFGIWNAKLPAEEKPMTFYLDDVSNSTNSQPDPASNAFNAAPAGWVGRNNSFTAKDYIVRPYHEFGWAKTLPWLDGLNGASPMYTIASTDRYCMGGIIYLASYENLNVPRASYGAGLNGTLNTRDHHFYATGRFKLDWANVDAAELFG